MKGEGIVGGEGGEGIGWVEVFLSEGGEEKICDVCVVVRDAQDGLKDGIHDGLGAGRGMLGDVGRRAERRVGRGER